MSTPGTDERHTPSPGACTRRKEPPGSRSSRSKRTSMRLLPETEPICAEKTAKRSSGAAPAWQASRPARVGTVWACAGVPAQAARSRVAVQASLRTAPEEQHGSGEVSPPPCREGPSGDLVQGPVAALGRRQAPALGRDRPTLHAVGVVDDHVDVALLGRIVGDLVDPRRAHPAPRLGERPRHVLLHADVVGRVVARRVARDVDARELVVEVLAVGLGIALGGVADEHLLLVVAVPRPAAAGEAALGEDHRADQRAAEQKALGERLARVAHLVELLADLRVLDRLLVAREVAGPAL